MRARVVIPNERFDREPHGPLQRMFDDFSGAIQLDESTGDLFIRNETAITFEGDADKVRPTLTRLMTWLHGGDT